MPSSSVSHLCISTQSNAITWFWSRTMASASTILTVQYHVKVIKELLLPPAFLPRCRRAAWSGECWWRRWCGLYGGSRRSSGGRRSRCSPRTPSINWDTDRAKEFYFNLGSWLKAVMIKDSDGPCVRTDSRHLLLLHQLLQLVGLLLWFDGALFHVVHGLQRRQRYYSKRACMAKRKDGHVTPPTHLVKEVTDSELVVVQQNLLFCGEEPLAHGQTGSWDGRGVVLDIQFVGELVWSKFTHCRRNERGKKEKDILGVINHVIGLRHSTPTFTICVNVGCWRITWPDTEKSNWGIQTKRVVDDFKQGKVAGCHAVHPQFHHHSLEQKQRKTETHPRSISRPDGSTGIGKGGGVLTW